ncbi:MAG: phosphoribosylanthranilate isomerase [bacterium]
MVKVKICGITNQEDAWLACDLGADALGFILYPKSPRYANPEIVLKIVRSLPPFVTTVGVFVNETNEDLNKLCQTIPFKLIQLHGDETPGYCKRLHLPCIKALRVNRDLRVSQMQDYEVSGFLLDTFDRDSYGGTGTIFDWNIARAAKKYGRILLSGGLTPDNVVSAVEEVWPYAVDICSGVEASPGKKDPEKLRAFFDAIKSIQPHPNLNLESDQ